MSYARLKDGSRMRKEPFGVLLYSAESSHIETLSPASAAILSLLDGSRCVEETGHDVETLFQLDADEGGAVLRSLLQRHAYFFDHGAEPLTPPWRRFPMEAFLYDAPLWKPADAAFERCRLSAPITITYVVTRRCNFRCRYCYIKAESGDDARDAILTTDRLYELIEEADRLGVARFMLTGGEPLLRRDLFHIVRHALAHGIDIDLNTNGYQLGDEAVADRLADAGLRRVVVSIDAVDPGTQMYLSSISRSAYQRVLAGIRNCRARGIRVKTNSIIAAPNIRELPALIVLLADMGVQDVTLAHYTGAFYRRKESLFASLSDYQWLADQLATIASDYPELNLECQELEGTIRCLRDGVSPGLSRCDNMKRGLVIFPDGRTTFCDTLIDTDEFFVGDLRMQSIEETWNAKRYEFLMHPDRYRFAGTACADCERFERCMSDGHCYSRALVRFGSGYAPDPFCPKVYDPGHRLF